MGNYLQWIINRSEQDLSDNTIKNPLTDDGTTHGFVRFPTHLSIMRLLIWKARTQPTGYRTYILNCWQSDEYANRAAYAADIIFRSDPTALIVNIHAATESEMKLGALNTYTKWPVFFKSSQFTPEKNWYGFAHDLQQSTIDDRNWFINNWKERFPINTPFNYGEFDYNVQGNKKWFIERNATSPWEITEEHYESYEHVPVDQIIDLSIGDILSDNFIEQYATLIDQQDVGVFNWHDAKDFHPMYKASQRNLQLLSSLDRLQKENTATEFMFDNYFTESLLLSEISDLDSCTGWESMPSKDICNYFNIDVEKNTQ